MTTILKILVGAACVVVIAVGGLWLFQERREAVEANSYGAKLEQLTDAVDEWERSNRQLDALDRQSTN